ADTALLTTGLNEVVEYEPADLTVTVQAGMRLASLQNLLRQHRQMLALDPPSQERATIGGVVASNSSGPMRLLYGTARDLVIGIRVANAEGMLTKAGGRVVKNVTGYDLDKLYTGSFGTLGIIVELSFKLHPLPQSEGTMLAIFDSPWRAQKVVQQIVKSPLGAAALTIIGAEAAAKVVNRRFPEGGAALIARAAGFERAVARQTRDMAALCLEALSADVLADREGEQLWAAVRGFADLTLDTEDAILKLGVPPASSASAMETMQSLGVTLDLDVASIAHAGTGVVYSRARNAASMAEGAMDRLTRLIAEGRSAAMALGGSLVVERCPPALKSSIDVWGDVSSSFRVMTALKERFDPHGVLNPGRFVGHL
ncbi:MAG TPA: FAD-binding oxidoreductase, partial [Chloroflexota bacterium]|nr:FAD-binding oxidoreductase [Chloroflexota bacterium]